jgi:hypothetical protein
MPRLDAGGNRIFPSHCSEYPFACSSVFFFCRMILQPFLLHGWIDWLCSQERTCVTQSSENLSIISLLSHAFPGWGFFLFPSFVSVFLFSGFV